MSHKKVILGDTHDGKSVYMHEYDGRRTIHKPRSADVELAFRAFLLHLEEKGFLYIPGYVTVTASDHTGHEVEIVEQTPAGNGSQAEMYYRRCGALLFFAYIFASKDLHAENIIACKDRPVIVDYETLLQGSIRRKTALYQQSLATTVLATHLLPNWTCEAGSDIDQGGFTGKAKNVLYLDQQPACLYMYEKEFTEGFQYAYSFALKNRGFFKSIIGEFRGCSFRMLLRPTRVYIALSEITKDMPEEEKKEVLKKLLARAYERDVDPDQVKRAEKVLEVELAAVLKGEIPLFCLKGDQRHLYSGDSCVWREFLERSPLENSLYNIEQLTEEDRSDQIRIIKQAIGASKPIERNEAADHKERDVNEYIFHVLENNAVQRLGTKWIRLNRDHHDILYLQSIGFGLYDGLLGILCCYAALFYKTNKKEVLNLLMNYYNIYHEAGIPESIGLTDKSASLQVGIGGQIKALAHIYDLTGERVFKDDIERIASAVRVDQTDLHGEPDVLTGYGGLALALPDIGGEKALQIAEFLAEKLMAYVPRLTGFAHGAAGISLALGEIGHILGSKVYDHKILELLKWENRYFCSESTNWYDLRNGKNTDMSGWCTGAPGIVMSRKRLMSITTDSEIKNICRKDIKRAQKLLSSPILRHRDNLCCGNTARLMACANLNIDNNALKTEIESKVRAGSLKMVHIAGTCDFNAGLMQGIAGIGYALAMSDDSKCGEMLI